MGCAAALATIRVYEEDNLIENARKMGAIMKELGRGTCRRSILP